MNASPITSWEGAEAYFTFADSPLMIVLLLGISMALTAGAIVAIAKHESESYRKHR